jgi:hypothetical protein
LLAPKLIFIPSPPQAQKSGRFLNALFSFFTRTTFALQKAADFQNFGKFGMEENPLQDMKSESGRKRSLGIEKLNGKMNKVGQY